MEQIYSLDGTWTLYERDATAGESDGAIPADARRIPAQVPGNVELDLSRAGLLPADLLRGMNPCKAEAFESSEWWYERTFDAPNLPKGARAVLHFEAVDCIAEYELNGVRIGESANAFIQHEFDVTAQLQPHNTLRVHIRSALLAQLRAHYDQYMLRGWHINGGQSLRKPAHSFGWDIFPRAVSAGLWKSVSLRVRDGYAIEDVGYVVQLNAQQRPRLQMWCTVQAPVGELISGALTVKFCGMCGADSSFAAEAALARGKTARVEPAVQNPKLWWPYGYGDANVYDTVVQLCRGETVLAEQRLNVGLRVVELQRTETLNEPNACFRFLVNGEEIMARGSNWVPLSPYHSQDRARYAEALALVSDIGCNILRVWGGGVYEQPEFYDYCDRHGVMVWQDFMMACQLCPMDDAMMQNMAEEFRYEICALRNHPSIVLWAGDNEIDEAMASGGIDPGMNRITRELLPRLIRENDGTRPYLPSSPYISSRAYQAYVKGEDVFVERHLWGARDYYKASFYANSRACFVSETGYHGCPAPESVRRMVDPECVWPYANEQWTLHSSDQHGNDARVRLMADQIRQLFAFDPQTLEEFSLASQISQAEAKKYFIERVRTARPQKSGIIWWNLLDGWPQMSDAVVDAYGVKKLAYDYIKRAQAPVALMMREMHDWHYTLVAANDTRTPVSGDYRVTDIETGAELAAGAFAVGENRIADLTDIRMMYCDQRMLLIEWTVNGVRSYNHYLCGMPAFSFPRYVQWMRKLQKIAGGDVQ